MERTITVRASGKVSLKPDLVITSLTLKSIDKDYLNAFNVISDKYNNLQDNLINIGFDKSDLKTSSYNISSEYESVSDENGRYKTVFKGYSFIQNLKIEFAFDNMLLNKVLNTISTCISEPEIDIRFSVKNRDKVIDKLLKDAIKNARKKALILSEAAEARLGEIINIDYNWQNKDFVSDSNYLMRSEYSKVGDSLRFDTEPENIVVEETVLTIWSLI